MKKTFLIIILLTTFFGFAYAEPTANEVLSKAVNVLSGSKGIDASFKINGGGYGGTGTMKSSGGKFHIVFPGVEVWYNGKDLYTYNKKTGETTIVKPGVSELAESNPLAYITGAQKQYTAAFGKGAKAGHYQLVLTPISKKTDIKKVELSIRKSDYKVEKMVIYPSSGSAVNVEITNLKTGVNISSSEFEYPKTKYPKAEIIDLR